MELRAVVQEWSTAENSGTLGSELFFVVWLDSEDTWLSFTGAVHDPVDARCDEE